MNSDCASGSPIGDEGPFQLKRWASPRYDAGVLKRMWDLMPDEQGDSADFRASKRMVDSDGKRMYRVTGRK